MQSVQIPTKQVCGLFKTRISRIRDPSKFSQRKRTGFSNGYQNMHRSIRKATRTNSEVPNIARKSTGYKGICPPKPISWRGTTAARVSAPQCESRGRRERTYDFALPSRRRGEHKAFPACKKSPGLLWLWFPCVCGKRKREDGGNKKMLYFLRVIRSGVSEYATDSCVVFECVKCVCHGAGVSACLCAMTPDTAQSDSAMHWLHFFYIIIATRTTLSSSSFSPRKLVLRGEKVTEIDSEQGKR